MASQPNGDEKTIGKVNNNDAIVPIPAKQQYKVNTGLRPPKRPGYGQEGRPIKLRANHLSIKLDLKNLHHYDIDITPQKIPKNINRLIFEDLVEKHRASHFKNDPPAFDGNKNFYTVSRLPIKDNEELVITGALMIEDRKLEYKVKVKYAAEVNLFQLQQFWEGNMIDMPQDPVQAIDVAMKHVSNIREVPVGRSLYAFPKIFQDLGEGCQLWLGRFQSVRPTQWKMTLNVDLAATAFYQKINMIDFMTQFLRQRQPPMNMTPHQRVQLQREIKNLKVRVNHTGAIKRTYVIRELSKVPASQLSFTMEKDGVKKTTTVAEYFTKQYNHPLQFPNLPCLRVGSMQKQTYLPMEVCDLKEGQKKNNKLTDQMVATMIKFTAIPAPERERKIMEEVRKANYNKDPVMKAFGITVGDSMLETEGRIIQPPDVCYMRNNSKAVVTPIRGVWDMRKGEKFIRGAQLNNWALISFEDERRCNLDQIFRFFAELSDMGRDMGMTMNSKPGFHVFARDHFQAEGIFSQIVKDNPTVQMIVVILRARDLVYGEIKRLGDVVFGVVTQCIQSKNVQRTSPATLSNICLKINVKCEGLNNIVNCPSRAALFKEPVIVLGADVTHPMPGDMKMPSIAAVVGSMDSYPQKYTACVKAQGHRVEIIENLCEMVQILLKRFYRATSAKPQKIIFYRDGVSEGQFLQVLQYELQAIQKACTLLEKDYQPLITFAVVQKRHHTRLFCANERDRTGKSGNIPPGTVVDKGIVHPREFDFFLCSHAGIQGTSRPTHYHVLWDDNNFTADAFQSFTYALCHTYVKCNRAVSIPAPAYYAHHVAFRARHHLGDLQSDSGSTATAVSENTPTYNLENINKAINLQPNTAQRMYFA